MQKILAVLTQEEKYSRRLCEYINRKRELNTMAVPFSSVEECGECSRKKRIELLLYDGSVVMGHMAELEDIGASRLIYLLSDRKSKSEVPGGRVIAVIPKYQSAEDILKAIIQYAPDLRTIRTAERFGRNLNVIGIYSPEGRCGKTSFALTLSRELARKSSALYLGFEEFSPVLRLLGTDKKEGIPEAVYLMKQNKLDAARLSQLIERSGGFDWLAPAGDPDDEHVITGDDCAVLLKTIVNNSDYEYIVLDMNRYSGQADVLIDYCSVLYVPRSGDKVSDIKSSSFREYIRKERGRDIAEKIVEIELPYIKEASIGKNYTETLFYGIMGNFVRQLVSGNDAS